MRSGGQGFSRHPDVLEVTDEATRRPESNPLSVSPRARPHGPTFGCRTPRARGGPPRTSAPTTHPAPTRPGAGRPQAGGSQFIATGAGGHPAGQHGARGDTEEVESWFTRTSVMDCLIPRPGMAQLLSDAPRRGRRGYFARRAVRRWGDVVRVESSWRTDEAARKPASKPLSVSPCLL